MARHFVSPLVLRSLVDRLASYKPPAHTETSRGRVGKYGIDPSSPPPVSAEVEGTPPPPPTDTEDLVVKLLACLMVHPQQGQRARLVLRDELPESLYMSLHQAGSIPADIKGDSVTALPPLPDRDTDNKLYPNKGNAGAGAAGAVRSVLATGNATAPTSLAVPLCIVVTPPDEFEAEQEDDEVEVEQESAAVSGSGGSERPRERSLKRALVAALSPHPNASESGGWDGNNRLPSLVSAGMNTPGGRSSRGLWQRASTGWSSSVPNTPGTNDVSEEHRPMTLPSSHGPRGRSLSSKKSPSKTKLGGERAASLSLKSPRSPARQSSLSWAAVGRALSPGVVQPPESEGK